MPCIRNSLYVLGYATHGINIVIIIVIVVVVVVVVVVHVTHVLCYPGYYMLILLCVRNSLYG